MRKRVNLYGSVHWNSCYPYVRPGLVCSKKVRIYQSPLRTYLNNLFVHIDSSPTSPTGVNVGQGWIAVMVRACLEGMAELDEESPYGTPGGLSRWLAEDVSIGYGYHFSQHL